MHCVPKLCLATRPLALITGAALDIYIPLGSSVWVIRPDWQKSLVPIFLSIKMIHYSITASRKYPQPVDAKLVCLVRIR